MPFELPEKANADINRMLDAYRVSFNGAAEREKTVATARDFMERSMALIAEKELTHKNPNSTYEGATKMLNSALAKAVGGGDDDMSQPLAAVVITKLEDSNPADFGSMIENGIGTGGNGARSGARRGGRAAGGGTQRIRSGRGL